MPAHKLSLDQKLWPKVNKTEDCWLWTGGVTGDGYGQVHHEGRARTVHRLSYEVFKGTIPKGLLVCHSCDIRNCVNPEHLFLGTLSDNARDKVKKGRNYVARGEKSNFSKLKGKQVREIRKKGATGEFTHKQLAEEYSVTRPLIGYIMNRKIWTHLKENQ